MGSKRDEATGGPLPPVTSDEKSGLRALYDRCAGQAEGAAHPDTEGPNSAACIEWYFEIDLVESEKAWCVAAKEYRRALVVDPDNNTLDNNGRWNRTQHTRGDWL